MEAVSCVDTVLAPVAETARKAGANWINDVSGGGRDPAPARKLIRSSEMRAWTLPSPKDGSNAGMILLDQQGAKSASFLGERMIK